MPQTECAHCGAAYETLPELSADAMRKSLLLARVASVISLAIALVSFILLETSRPEKLVVQYEHTGEGIVRYYDSSKRLLLFEGSYGMKVFQPICQKELSVNIHMGTDIAFRWVPYNTWHFGRGPDAGEECYDIQSVKKIGPDAQ